MLLSTAARNAIADAIGVTFNGTGHGHATPWSGSTPVEAVDLHNPAFEAAVNGTVNLDTTPALTPATTTFDGWCDKIQFTAGGGALIAEASVDTADADVIWNPNLMVYGHTWTLTAFSITVLAS